jgi:hypothetical protein
LEFDDVDVARSFPCTIKDAYLDVFFSSSYEKLTNFLDIPEMDFNIRHLEGSVIGLLPWTELKGGHFRMSEKNSVSILDFSDFSIESADGKVEADFRYYITQGIDDSLKLSLDIENVNPSQIIQFEENDTVPEILDAILDEKVHCNLSLPVDSLIKIKTVYLEAVEFIYTTKEDTSEIKFLELSINDINFRRSQQFNLLDLGAVALAGPAGILFSKGSDYAMILASRSGGKTTISQVKILKTLLAPVTKSLNNITATECETYYEGRVEHPVEK